MRTLPSTTLFLPILLPTLLLAACNASAPSGGSAATTASAGTTASATAPAVTPAPMPVTTPPAADAAVPAFVDKVWRVEQAGGPVDKGSTYSFLGDGTLVETGPHSTPMTGRWSYEDSKLTMSEDGILYPADIVLLDASHFTFRSHNPGGTVDVATTLATDVPLPPAM